MTVHAPPYRSDQDQRSGRTREEVSSAQREQLAAMIPFLPFGTPVLNLGFAADIFEQCLAQDCPQVRIAASHGAGAIAQTSLDDDEVPEGCYVLMHAPLTADRDGAHLLRSVAAADAHLLCVCEDGDDDTYV